MPSYSFLIDHHLDTATTPLKINAMRTLGVPYAVDYAKNANRDLMIQAKGIADDLQKDGIKVAPTKEIIALIAYLQRLGIDITKK